MLQCNQTTTMAGGTPYAMAENSRGMLCTGTGMPLWQFAPVQLRRPSTNGAAIVPQGESEPRASRRKVARQIPVPFWHVERTDVCVTQAI